eukprot:CAMPEP_0118982438 /NCGR_PEP_ID=MMETSP1173-20130426/32806_1 /TAXON_ID=1034831 /ORGANISM="Rhizochromulina marina cf, Strain CCMP1243" /LENGTH=237 /DNA_ID=CAMNT_0006932931 /DNA_START=33 /DNA_END=746 /DNA_ORIENTATION=+
MASVVTRVATFAGADALALQGLRGGRIAVMLGSFDPFHRGHQALCSSLLESHGCAAVLLLVPEVHFEKTIEEGKNASLQQRVDMLRALYQGEPRVGYGVAHEVLFVRLAQGLWREAFPSAAEVTFGMGQDRYACMLDSRSYFDTLGLEWTAGDQQELERLRDTCIVFSRDQTTPLLSLPGGVSSTLVRQALVGQRSGAVSSSTPEVMVDPAILAYIWQNGLYSTVGEDGQGGPGEAP